MKKRSDVKVVTDEFRFCLPLDIIKSDTEVNEEWRIAGYASTPNEDRQGDEIIQKGLDISDFVNHGWLNYDHSEVILGYPDKDKCSVTKKGFYVEGILLKDIPQSKTMWETAIALQKSGSDRRLGFSVEGKILKKNDQGQIVKAKVYNVAVTPNPVNTDCTWSALIKSFTSNEADLIKALEAGHGDASGSPIIPESLESAFKTLSYAIGDDAEAKLHMDTLKARLLHKQDIITKSEAILYLQLVKGLSFVEASILYNDMSKKEDIQHE